MLAECLKLVVPAEYHGEIDWLAGRIALNRERAGFHYGSDSDFGRFLATKCLDKWLAAACPIFKDIRDNAKNKEWS